MLLNVERYCCNDLTAVVSCGIYFSVKNEECGFSSGTYLIKRENGNLKGLTVFEIVNERTNVKYRSVSF